MRFRGGGSALESFLWLLLTVSYRQTFSTHPVCVIHISIYRYNDFQRQYMSAWYKGKQKICQHILYEQSHEQSSNVHGMNICVSYASIYRKWMIQGIVISDGSIRWVTHAHGHYVECTTLNMAFRTCWAIGLKVRNSGESCPKHDFSGFTL